MNPLEFEVGTDCPECGADDSLRNNQFFLWGGAMDWERLSCRKCGAVFLREELRVVYHDDDRPHLEIVP